MRQYRNDKQYQEALFYQGLCEMKMGQETQAKKTWEQVQNNERWEKTKSKTYLLTLEQLTLYYGGKGKESDEKKILSQLLAEFPDNPVTVKLHVQAAERCMKESNYAEALVYYRAVEGKLTDNDQKNKDLALAMTSQEKQTPQQLLAAANESFEKDNVEQAIKLYQTFLKQNPESPLALEAKTKLGWSYYVQGKWQEAENHWRDVIKKGSPKNEWVGQSRWHMIQLLAGPAGKPEKAIEMCEIQAKEFPNSARGERALFSRAWLHWTRKEWAKAKAAFDDLIAAYPDNANDPPIQTYVRECDEGIRNARSGGK